MGSAPKHLTNLKVAELFLPEKNEWDLARISQWLPFEEEKIRMLKPSLMLILIQETHIVEGRPLKSLGISSISKKVGRSRLNTSSKVETEDHSLDAFRPTKPGNSPGIGH
ncbi:hypothetical protein HID58_075907 [Brassica napus]|uniref:Uncharacterized protein n=1 Tax=Brassica napus TaxID=3708 RepID=A0ABQ7YL09_BRANA|nr:hypothetical protein HID58_075907 [Brassica napus]